jgi:hypothetical protein
LFPLSSALATSSSFSVLAFSMCTRHVHMPNNVLQALPSRSALGAHSLWARVGVVVRGQWIK